MPSNGLIDGNAPPFILLVFILGNMYSALGVLRASELLIYGIKFKKFARGIAYLGSFIPLFLGFMVTFRIFKNGIDKECTFYKLDVLILTGIIISFLFMIISSLVSSRIKRKYPGTN